MIIVASVSFIYSLGAPADYGAIVVIVWADEAAGAAVIGPTLFNEHLMPVLAASQERSIGPAAVF